LLYLLSGLKTPTHGKVTYEGRDLAEMGDEGRAMLRLREFGFVFQQPYLLGYLSAIENVLVTQGDPAEASDLLERLGVLPKAHRLPHELSGGERQRVCVARALLARPQVIFADEPTASLDHTNGVAVVSLLNQHRGTGSLVMVTHDPTMLEGADRIVRIVDGQIVP
jgi:putative ABC transport system ATP-binding protein